MRPTQLQLTQLNDLLEEMGSRRFFQRACMLAWRECDDWLRQWTRDHPGLARQPYRRLPGNVRITMEERQEMFDGIALTTPMHLERQLILDEDEARFHHMGMRRYGSLWWQFDEEAQRARIYAWRSEGQPVDPTLR